MSKRTPGQIALLQAVRLRDNKEIGTVIEQTGIDDLEWFVQMLEFQLEETPHWVKDQKVLGEIQAWHRRARTMAAGILHYKRVNARRREGVLKLAWDALLVVVGAVIGWALALASHAN